MLHGMLFRSLPGVIPLPDGDDCTGAVGIDPRPLQLRQRVQKAVFDLLTADISSGRAKGKPGFSRSFQNLLCRNPLIAFHGNEEYPARQNKYRGQKERKSNDQ